MFDKMKQLMEMKKQAERIKKELDQESVNIDNGKGIKFTVNGSQNFKSVEIDESLLMANNKRKIETDLLLAINQAIAKSQQVAARKMKDVMPGFPGL